MPIPPQKLREAVFQILYSYDMGYAEEDAIIKLLTKELAVSKKNLTTASDYAKKVINKVEDIDALIAKTSHAYAFERIQRVEKNILRLALFEILYDDSISAKIALAEAIRLSRKFSTPESANFINAILDAIYKASLGEAADEKEIADASSKLKLSEETLDDLGKNQE